MGFFRKIVYGVSHILDLVGQAALVALMAVVIANICLRWLRIPATGFFELICLLGAVAFVFTWACTQIQKGHLHIDALVSRFPERVKSIITILTHFLSVLICAVISWQCISLGYALWHQGQLVSTVVSLPLFPIAFIISFGVLMLFLTLLVDFVDLIRGNKKQ